MINVRFGMSFDEKFRIWQCCFRRIEILHSALFAPRTVVKLGCSPREGYVRPANLTLFFCSRREQVVRLANCTDIWKNVFS